MGGELVLVPAGLHVHSRGMDLQRKCFERYCSKFKAGMVMLSYHVKSNIDDPCEEESGPADGHHGGDCGGGQVVFSS